MSHTYELRSQAPYSMSDDGHVKQPVSRPPAHQRSRTHDSSTAPHTQQTPHLPPPAMSHDSQALLGLLEITSESPSAPPPPTHCNNKSTNPPHPPYSNLTHLPPVCKGRDVHKHGLCLDVGQVQCELGDHAAVELVVIRVVPGRDGRGGGRGGRGGGGRWGG